MNSPPPSFGSLLRQHRLRLGWSQERLAEQASLSAEGVSALERGKIRMPRGDTVALLVEALGLEGEARDAFQQAAAAGRMAREDAATRSDSGPDKPSARTASVPAKPARRWQVVRLPIPLKAVAGLAIALCLALLLTVRLAPGGRAHRSELSARAASEHLRLESVWQPHILEPFVLREPRAIARARDGNLLIADYARATLVRVTPRGRLLDVWGGPGVTPGQFIRPTALAVGVHGDVYVADTGNNRIQELTAQGQPIRQWSDQSTLGKPLKQPEGVAVDGAGDVYIADTGNRRVVELDASGNMAWQQSLPAAAVAVDPRGRVMVLVAGGYAHARPRINVLSPGGTVQGTLPARRGHVSRPLYGNYRQWHVAIARDGGVYATDGTSSTIWTFGKTGRAIASSELHLSAPSGIAIGSSGETYVTELTTGTLLQVSAQRRVQGRWHMLQPATTPFRAPSGIAVDRAGHVYLADTGNDRVVELSAAGDPLRTWGNDGSQMATFERPTGLAVDQAGKVYVADSGHNAVGILSSAGHAVARWTGPLRSPRAIALHRDGTVSVADGTSIYTFSSAGQVIMRIGAPVSGLATDGRGSLVLAAHLPSITRIARNGKTEAVISIESGAIDAVAESARGTVYALDSSAGRLYVIDSRGALLQTLGGRGRRPGELASPRGIAVDANGRVYVADTGNNRIDIFAPSR